MSSKPILDPDFHAELVRFGEDVDVEAMEFEAVIGLLIGFVRDALLTDERLDALEVDPAVRAEFRDIVARSAAFAEQGASAEDTKATRVRAWKLHDGLPAGGGAQRIAEIVVLCAYDRESAEFDTFGPEPMIESIMTSLARLGPGYCKAFRLRATGGSPDA